MDANTVQDLHKTLVQHWGLAPGDSSRLDWEELIELLSRRVESLLQHEYERLLSALYTIDVSEVRFAEAVSGQNAEPPARAVAKLILDRELEKYISRQRYAQGQEGETGPAIESRGPGELE